MTIRLRIQIFIGFVFLFSLFNAYFLSTYYHRKALKSEMLDRVRGIVKFAETVRSETAEKYWSDAEREESLSLLKSDWEKHIETVVPITQAMHMVKRHAELDNYQIRVPKVKPRNEKNEPTVSELSAIQTLKKGEEELFEYDKKKHKLNYYSPIRLSKECLVCHGNPDDSYALWSNTEGKDITGAQMENWKEGEIHGAYHITMDTQYYEKNILNFTYIFLIGLGLMVVIAIFIVSLIFRSLLGKPLDQFLNTASEISDGDLRSSFPGTLKGELSKLASALESAKVKVKNALYSAGNASKAASSIMKTARATTNDVSSTSETIASSIEEISASIEEISASIDVTAENAVTTENTIDGLSSVARSTTQSMETAMKTMSDIINRAQVIREIAEQTNLLALNATIEAARAGEHGRGFAIVATEVGKLAELSNQASNEISHLISKNVEDSRETHEHMQRVLPQVGEVQHLIENLKTSTAHEREALRQISISLNEISNSLGEYTSSITNLEIDMEKLNEYTKKMNEETSFFKTK